MMGSFQLHSVQVIVYYMEDKCCLLTELHVQTTIEILMHETPITRLRSIFSTNELIPRGCH